MRILAVLVFLAPTLALAAPGDPAPHAAPANLPGVYQPYVPPPTRVPTPAPDSGVRVTRVEVHKDTMSVALKGGAAIPMGDTGRNNTTGWSAGMDLIYGASSIVDAAFGVSYASLPYKLTTAAKPQTSLGIGIKAIIKVMREGKLNVNIGGGMGYYFQNVATEVDKGPDPVNPNLRLSEVGYKASGGIGFSLGLAAALQFTPNFSIGVMADATQISLGGGTSDTPLYLLPSLTMTYTF